MRHIYWIPAGLLLLAWLSPLHVLPWMSWHNEVLAFFALLAGCGSALYVSRRMPLAGGVLVPSLALLPMLLLLAALLQWASGRIFYFGSVWVIASYALAVAAAAAAGHAAGRAGTESGAGGAPLGLEVLAWLLVCAALLQWLVAFSQVFSLWGGADWVARTAYATRAGGNFAQPNQAALLFVMATAGTAYLLLTRRIGRPVAAALLGMLALGLATTQSRSGLLATAVLVFGLVLRRQTLGGRRGMAAALGFLVLAVVLFQAWPGAVAAYWFQVPDAVNLTSSGRRVMWTQLLEALQQRPWTGWGVMQVAEAQNAVADRFPEVMAATYAHSVLLDLALWVGIPGLIASAYLVAAWLLPRLRQVRSVEACFCAALALPLLTQSLTEFPYAYSFFLVPVFFALGILDARLGYGAGLRLPRRWAVGLLALGTGVFTWAAVEYVRIEEDFRVARFEALRYGKTPRHYQPPRVVLLTQLGGLLQATRSQARPGMSVAELEQLEAVAMLHPWGATSYRYLAALALNGRMDEARRQLQVLRALHGQKTYEGIVAVLQEMAVQYPVLRQLASP